MIRALLKLGFYLGVAWVVAADWQALREQALAAAAAAARMLPLSLLEPAMAGLLGLLLVLATAYLVVAVCLVMPVPVDSALGPSRHPFPAQPLRIRLRWRRPRFVVATLLNAVLLLLAVRALPDLTGSGLQPAPGLLRVPDWQAAWTLHAGLHVAAAGLAWPLLRLPAMLAGRLSPCSYGFVRYHAVRMPVWGFLWRQLLFVHLPLAAFSATALAHPWHVWLVLGSLTAALLAAVLAQVVTAGLELRRDRWLASRLLQPRLVPGQFSGRDMYLRTVAFLHPDEPAALSLPLAVPEAPRPLTEAAPDDQASAASDASGTAAAEAALLSNERADVSADGPSIDAGGTPVHAAAGPHAVADTVRGDGRTDPAAAAPDGAPVPAGGHALAVAAALRDAGDSGRARRLLGEVIASGEPHERQLAEAMLRDLPGRWRKLRFAAAATAVVGMAALALVGWQWWSLPSADETLRMARSAHVHVRKIGSGESSRITLLGNRYDYSLNTSLANISPHFVNAVVASEDHRFFDHGVAYKLAKFAEAGLICALKRLNVLATSRACAGNSTIPQQLARNLFLSETRSIERKLKELLWAIKMEAGLDKRTILELYMNRLYLGRGNFGVELAARDYFGKSASELDVYESALLAAAVKRPGWNWSQDRAGAMRRAELILALMRRQGLAPADARFAPGYRPRTGNRPPRKPYIGHLWQWIRPQVRAALDDLPAGDYKVLTTLDAEVEIYAERHLAAEVERLARAGLPVSQGAVVVMRPGGAVLAMVGGAGDSVAARGLNRAKRTRGLVSRPPASAFKPFVYLSALEQGLGPDSLIDASPVDIPMPAPQPPYRPRNHDGREYDRVTLRDGLVRSVNTAAVHLLRDRVGFDRLFDVLRRLGIDTSGFRRQWGVALGSAGVPLVQMTSAYAVFASGGLRTPSYAFTAITTDDGKTVWRRPRGAARRVVQARHASALNDMLQGVLGEGTGTRAREGLPPAMQLAGKTGTGDEFVDAWFIGYGADLVVGVWIGNDVPRSMPGVYGGTAPARVFNRIVKDLVDYTERVDPDAPLP